MAGFPAIMARGWLAWTLADRGEFEDGIRVGGEALQMAEAFAQPFSLARTLNDLGYLYCVRGSHNQAIPLLERALAIWREWNFLIVSPVTAGLLGYAYALAGRLPEGLALLQDAEAKGESLELKWPRALQDIHLADANLMANRVDAAAGYAERALALARERHQRGYEAWAVRLLGEIAMQSDASQAEKAEQRFREAMMLADELGARPLTAHCHLGVGKLHRRLGKRREAIEQFTIASTMYRAMGMQFWLTQAESAARDQP